MNAVWTALLILHMPVAAPKPAPVVEVWVLLDSTERSAGLRHEIEWSRDHWHPRHRYASTEGVSFQVIEWNEVASFEVPSIPAWRDSRYPDWQPVTGSGDGSGILKIADAVKRDEPDYERFLRTAGEMSANEHTWNRMLRYEEWKERR